MLSIQSINLVDLATHIAHNFRLEYQPSTGRCGIHLLKMHGWRFGIYLQFPQPGTPTLWPPSFQQLHHSRLPVIAFLYIQRSDNEIIAQAKPQVTIPHPTIDLGIILQLGIIVIGLTLILAALIYSLEIHQILNFTNRGYLYESEADAKKFDLRSALRANLPIYRLLVIMFQVAFFVSTTLVTLLISVNLFTVLSYNLNYIFPDTKTSQTYKFLVVVFLNNFLIRSLFRLFKGRR